VKCSLRSTNEAILLPRQTGLDSVKVQETRRKPIGCGHREMTLRLTYYPLSLNMGVPSSIWMREIGTSDLLAAVAIALQFPSLNFLFHGGNSSVVLLVLKVFSTIR
jgi:hypothetical protein